MKIDTINIPKSTHITYGIRGIKVVWRRALINNQLLFVFPLKINYLKKRPKLTRRLKNRWSFLKLCKYMYKREKESVKIEKVAKRIGI